MIIGVLGILNTVLLLLHTNVNLGTLLPAAAGIVLVVVALLKLTRFQDRPLLKNRILRNVALVCLALLIVSFVGVESLILTQTRSQQEVEADYLVILGAAVKGETVSLTLKQRLDKGADYLNRYPDAKVVVTGGQGFGEAISEAEAMKRYLLTKGIEPARIVTEDQATSTMENFEYTRRLLDNSGNGDSRKIMIVTSDYHMLRSKMLARRNGFEPYGITCGTPKSVWVNSYAREYFAMIKSYLFDR